MKPGKPRIESEGFRDLGGVSEIRVSQNLAHILVITQVYLGRLSIICSAGI